ncbi:hypothetical protein CL656_03645 [bacterium]|nr:hypothetical protein [bacterium]
MKVEVICRNDDLNLLLNIKPKKYDESLNNALTTIGKKQVISSWKDSLASGRFKENISEYLEVPVYGCLLDQRSVHLNSIDKTIKKIWAIGGDNGWYYANTLWKIRGFLDKLVGGVGLRRGRTNPYEIHPGDSLDFWRVLYANKEEKRLLLFAEMKVPGDAWLEFKIMNNELIQTATFQPKGILGRLYWYSVLPLHGLVFNGLINALNKHE